MDADTPVMMVDMVKTVVIPALEQNNNRFVKVQFYKIPYGQTLVIQSPSFINKKRHQFELVYFPIGAL